MRKLPRWALLAIAIMIFLPIVYGAYIWATKVGGTVETGVCAVVVLIVGFIMFEVLMKPYFLLYRAREEDVKDVNEIDAEVTPKPRPKPAETGDGAEAAVRGDLTAKKKRVAAKPEPEPLKEEIREFMPGGKYAEDAPRPEKKPIRLEGAEEDERPAG